MPEVTLDRLRRYAIARTLFVPTTLSRAVRKLGFLQADLIRAPARAQDLTLRHRVKDYRVGDLERAYPKLAIEECFFVNYGFLPRPQYQLMHPRAAFRRAWDAATGKQAAQILRFVEERGTVHPREVEAHFALAAVARTCPREGAPRTRGSCWHGMVLAGQGKSRLRGARARRAGAPARAV